MPDPSLILAVFFVIIISSIIRGLTGFGLAMISMPLVSFLLPYKETVILVVVINLAFSIVHLFRSQGLISARYFILIIIFASIGVTVGVILLDRINNELLRTLAGMLIVAFAILMLTGYKLSFSSPGMAYSLASLTGGILAGSASIGGPVAALMLGGANLKHSEFRYSMSAFFLISYSYSTILFSINGSLNKDNLPLIIACIPAMIIGFFIGEKLIKILKADKLRIIILVLLVIAGLFTTWKGLSGLNA